MVDARDGVRRIRNDEPMMIARAARLAEAVIAGAHWDMPPWREVPSLPIRNFMGGKPEHFPKAHVKIAYDPSAVYVMFRIDDRYVRATAEKHQDSVCGDSCVEFFFTPGPDGSAGYFNLEMNCGGTMLFHFHPESAREGIEIPARDCETIATSHSLPRIVDPEIEEPVTWTVAYAVPVALLSQYTRVCPPAPRATWRANFYKCADNTSHPHWLTWSPVDYPRPNFHLPQGFGLLEFR